MKLLDIIWIYLFRAAKSKAYNMCRCAYCDIRLKRFCCIVALRKGGIEIILLLLTIFYVTTLSAQWLHGFIKELFECLSVQLACRGKSVIMTYFKTRYAEYFLRLCHALVISCPASEHQESGTYLQQVIVCCAFV